MSLKYSTTTADYLIWSDAMNLIRKLAKDENYKISLLIALWCFTGLRISDILSLRWKQILGADEFTVIEKKTGKVRTIRLNPQLQQHIKECYEHINPVGINAPILISQKGTIFTVQRINIILKEVKKKYRLKIKNFSCHSLRKTFGRQVYNMNNENAELALVKLMELFNHSSVAITKRYLGLRQEEILQTYDCLSFWWLEYGTRLLIFILIVVWTVLSQTVVNRSSDIHKVHNSRLNSSMSFTNANSALSLFML